MPISTLTSKGQTTIPAAIRDFLNLQTGDRLEFITQEDGKVMLVPATEDVAALKGLLPKPEKTVSLEAMQKAIREHHKP
jgi:antitoxin PrlF